MAKLLIPLIIVLFCLDTMAQPIYQWAGNIGPGNSDNAKGIAVDALGNVYVAGEYSGTSDFDLGVGTFNMTGAGSGDIFFAKYSSSGALIWAKSIGGSGNETLYRLALDTSGNVYIVGYYTGTVDFDPNGGITNLSGVGGTEGYFAKYNSSGSLVWAKKIAGTLSDGVMGITADNAGNVYVTGYFSGTVDFDPGLGIQNLTSVSGIDGFIGKYDVGGNYIWANSIGGSGQDKGSDIVVDGSGNCYALGKFTVIVDFDPGAGTANLTSAGAEDIYLAAYTSGGNYIWADRMGGTASDGNVGTSIVLDASGNLHIGGEFNGTADFDPGVSVANLISAGGTDIFLAGYDSGGNYIYAKRIGSTGTDYCRDIAESGGQVFITGVFSGTVDFDPAAGTANLVDAGFGDVFFGKYDLFGNYTWANKIGWTSGEEGYGIYSDGAAVYICGYFDSTVDFDPGAGIVNLTASSGDDIYIAKYSDCAVAPVQPGVIGGPVSICENSTATYSVSAVAGASSYIWTLPNGWSGSSVTTTINATASATNGNITVTANNACGSSTAQTLAVTINPIYTTNTTTAICQNDSILLGGAYQKTAGSYTDLLQSIKGCDSTVITALTINPLPTVTTTGDTSICAGGTATITAYGATTYTWQPGNLNGSMIMVSPNQLTTYTVEGTNQNGCKNTATFIVTVNPLPTVTLANQTAICADVVAFNLTGGVPAGGTYSGPGVNNNQFDPIIAGTGTHTITYTYTDANTGCSNSATNTILVNPLPPVPTISVNGTTFTSSAINGNQWYLNGNPVNGATNQNFTCTGNGSYSVCVTDANGCKSCSAALNFTTFSIDEGRLANSVTVYPNPFKNKLIFNCNDNASKIEVEILSVLGQIVYDFELKYPQTEIQLSQIPSGVYFIRVTNSDGTIIKKIIKD
jgi:hypothetical protein